LNRAMQWSLAGTLVVMVAACQFISGLNDVDVHGGTGANNEGGAGGGLPFDMCESDSCDAYCGFMHDNCGPDSDEQQFPTDESCCTYCETLVKTGGDLMCRLEDIGQQRSCSQVGPFATCADSCAELCGVAFDFCNASDCSVNTDNCPVTNLDYFYGVCPQMGGVVYKIMNWVLFAMSGAPTAKETGCPNAKIANPICI
jgi:hypothetical protein